MELLKTGPDGHRFAQEDNPLLWEFLSRTWTNDYEDCSHASALRGRYACVIPTRAAIDLLVGLSPTIELGCGTAYWAYLVQTAGGIMLPVDKFPLRPARTGKLRWFDQPEGEWPECYTAVTRGDESILDNDEFSSVTLMLCHPPKEGERPLGTDALRKFKGNYLVYIGEPKILGEGRFIGTEMNGTTILSDATTEARTGSQAFHALLEQEWNLELELPLPNWVGSYVRLCVYSRR